MDRMQGRAVIVTGGAAGAGRTAALALAAEGAKVTIGDIDRAGGEEAVAAIEARGGTALFVRTDVTDEGEVERLVRSAVERFGRLDGALNAAAERPGAPALLGELDEARFDRTLAVGLKGVWLSMKHEIRQMLAQEPAGGRIVNVASVNGLGGAPWAAAYAAAKAGVLALSKSAALDYARRRIQVNALAPGLLDTGSRKAAIAGLGLDAEGRRRLEEVQLAAVPARRLGLPEEVAEMAVWLLGEAPDYLTGATLVLDGGLTAPWR